MNNTIQNMNYPYKGISEITSKYSSTWAEKSMHNIVESVRKATINYKSPDLSAIQDSIKGINAFVQNQNNFANSLKSITQNYTSITNTAMHYYESNANILKAIDALNKNKCAIPGIGLDYSKIASALERVLESVADEQELDFDEIVNQTAEKYEADSDSEKETINEIKKKDLADEQNEKRIEFSKIIKKILLYVMIVLMPVIIDNGLQKVLSDNPPVINQYYIQNVTNIITNEGYDIDELDYYGYRIAKEELILRQKPDRSSKVTGHLKKGEVVRVIGKYKKWLEVTWVNSSGEEAFGWVQNYRLTRFAEK